MMVLSGCGNNPNPPSLQSTRPDGTPWRVLYRSVPDDPRSLDPQHAYDTISDRILRHICETPLQYAAFETDPFRLEPCLLREMPTHETRPDGREVYTFRLKPGLTFHDDPCFEASGGVGRAVTARDLEYSFKRMTDPKVECPVVSTFGQFVVGFQAAADAAKGPGGMDYARSISGIEVVDDLTLRITLLRPWAQMLYWFAMPFTAPVPHEAVAYYDGKVHDGVTRDVFRFHPVGTGAFQMVERAKGRLIRLKRFDRYNATRFPTSGWAPEANDRLSKHAGAALPLVDEIQLRVMREFVSQWRLFGQGYLEGTGVAKDAFKAAISGPGQLTGKYRDRGVHLYKDAELACYYFVFNMDDKLMGKNKKLRHALSLVYDIERLNQIFFNGMYLDAQQLLPPGVFGFQPGYQHPYKGGDLARAKQLMAEAGYPDGKDPATGQPLELTLDVSADDPTSRQMALFHRQQWEQLGLRLKINENLFATQLDKLDRGNFQIIQAGWNADYPDPENFMMLFYGPNVAPNGSNSSRFNDPEFDGLFTRMKDMENTPERAEVVKQMNAILNEKCPLMLLSVPVVYALNQPWCPRVSGNTMLSGGFKYADLDPAKRAKLQREWNRPERWPLAVLGALVVVTILGGVVLARRPA